MNPDRLLDLTERKGREGPKGDGARPDNLASRTAWSTSLYIPPSNHLVEGAQSPLHDILRGGSTSTSVFPLPSLPTACTSVVGLHVAPGQDMQVGARRPGSVLSLVASRSGPWAQHLAPQSLSILSHKEDPASILILIRV